MIASFVRSLFAIGVGNRAPGRNMARTEGEYPTRPVVITLERAGAASPRWGGKTISDR